MIWTALSLLKYSLEEQKERQTKQKKKGQFGGNISAFQWEQIAVNAAFHNPMMQDAIHEMREKCIEIGFQLSLEELQIPVLCYDDGGYAHDRSDPL